MNDRSLSPAATDRQDISQELNRCQAALTGLENELPGNTWPTPPAAS